MVRWSDGPKSGSRRWPVAPHSRSSQTHRGSSAGRVQGALRGPPEAITHPHMLWSTLVLSVYGIASAVPVSGRPVFATVSTPCCFQSALRLDPDTTLVSTTHGFQRFSQRSLQVQQAPASEWTCPGSGGNLLGRLEIPLAAAVGLGIRYALSPLITATSPAASLLARRTASRPHVGLSGAWPLGRAGLFLLLLAQLVPPSKAAALPVTLPGAPAGVSRQDPGDKNTAPLRAALNARVWLGTPGMWSCMWLLGLVLFILWQREATARAFAIVYGVRGEGVHPRVAPPTESRLSPKKHAYPPPSVPPSRPSSHAPSPPPSPPPSKQVPAAGPGESVEGGLVIEVHTSRTPSPELHAARAVSRDFRNRGEASSCETESGSAAHQPGLEPNRSHLDSPSASFTNDEVVQDAFEKVDAWAERGWLGRFRNRGIEHSFQNYITHLWWRQFMHWLIVAASILTLGPAVNFGLFLGGGAPLEAHASLQTTIYILVSILWCLALGFALQLRFGSHALRQRIARKRELIMAVFGGLILSGLTLPLLFARDDSAIAAGYNAKSVNYSDGRWHIVLEVLASGLLALSGVSPELYTYLALPAFGLWEARNFRLRAAIRNVYGAQAAAAYADPRDVESLIVPTSIAHALRIGILGFVVCYQRHAHARENFVILQLVRSSKDRTIDELKACSLAVQRPFPRRPCAICHTMHSICPPSYLFPSVTDRAHALLSCCVCSSVPRAQGTQRQLEVALAIQRAQSEAHNHIKFVQHSPRSRHLPRIRRRTSKDDDPAPGTDTPAETIAGAKGASSQKGSEAGVPKVDSKPVASMAAKGMSSASSQQEAMAASPDSRVGRHTSRHDARIAYAADMKDAVHSEISDLVAIANAEQHHRGHQDGPCMPAGRGMLSGRTFDWKQREVSPLRPEQGLVLPKPVRPRLALAEGADVGDDAPATAAEPTAGSVTSSIPAGSLSDEPSPQEGEPWMSFLSSNRYLLGNGFRMPEHHQKQVAQEEHAGVEA